MAFPTSPDNGQIYKIWYYDNNQNAWRVSSPAYETGPITLTFNENNGWGDATAIAEQDFTYVRNGDQVNISGYMILNGTTAIAQGSYFDIGGLPFTPKDFTAGALSGNLGSFHAYSGLGDNDNATGFISWQESSSQAHVFAQTVVGTVESDAPIFFTFSYVKA